ncbi:MAG: glycosyltransferase [Planctomycetes bacterium]|nr:glycosyltransferase [Planctomycetota bacterium]
MSGSQVRRRLRIAVLGIRGVPSTYGGLEYAADEVGRRLAARGHRVTVYNRSRFYPARPLGYRGLRLVFLPSWHSQHLDTLTHSLLSALHVLVFDTAEVVHVYGGVSGVFVPLLQAFGRRVVVSVDGLDWRRRKWGGGSRLYQRLAARLTARQADAVVVDNREAETHYGEAFGRRTVFIPYGADAGEPPPGDTLQRLGLRGGGYYLYAGRLSPEKGVHHLMRAFEGLRTERRLVVAGHDPYGGRYASELQATRDGRVLFPGFVHGDDFRRLVAGAYVHCLPSESEGLAPTLLVAMGLARCVVASDIEANRVVARDAALYFRSGDAVDLQRVLQGLDGDPSRVAAIGEAARARVRTEYRWEDVATAYEGLLLHARRRSREASR